MNISIEFYKIIFFITLVASGIMLVHSLISIFNYPEYVLLFAPNLILILPIVVSLAVLFGFDNKRLGKEIERRN